MSKCKNCDHGMVLIILPDGTTDDEVCSCCDGDWEDCVFCTCEEGEVEDD